MYLPLGRPNLMPPSKEASQHPPLPCYLFAKCKGITYLIHKGGDIQFPENFCPIALTSCVGKLFHRILASRLEEFMLTNNITNPELQKQAPRLPLNMCSLLNGIIDNARQQNYSLSTTFIDFRNAFESAPHKLISDMLHHVQVSVQIQVYMSGMCFKLTAGIHTDAMPEVPHPSRSPEEYSNATPSSSCYSS